MNTCILFKKKNGIYTCESKEKYENNVCQFQKK